MLTKYIYAEENEWYIGPSVRRNIEIVLICIEGKISWDDDCLCNEVLINWEMNSCLCVTCLILLAYVIWINKKQEQLQLDQLTFPAEDTETCSVQCENMILWTLYIYLIECKVKMIIMCVCVCYSLSLEWKMFELTRQGRHHY